jgi:hypothetical protein
LPGVISYIFQKIAMQRLNKTDISKHKKNNSQSSGSLQKTTPNPRIYRLFGLFTEPARAIVAEDTYSPRSTP